MRNKIIIMLLAVAVLFVPRAVAAEPGVRIGIQATAEFVPAAHVLVEHDAFTVPRMRAATRPDFLLSRQTAVSVKGTSGERLMLTCFVETVEGDMRRTDGANVRSRDCAGTSADVPAMRSILAGERAQGTVNLTHDMLPGYNGNSQAGIVIEVSYI